ncbi:MAG: twin-arginine translocase TatA/TatE family subunit [Anaerolineales bacterium]|nr:MAG: twin-arginine translocase TatA/TatE family subunit [Anaerolineales bacterium]
MEILLILVIALIVLGPKDMAKSGRTIGHFLRKVVTSSTWSTIQNASREIRYLPNKLMREAGLEELRQQLPDTQSIGKGLGYGELHKEARNISNQLSAWTTPPQQDTETNTSTTESAEIPLDQMERDKSGTSIDQAETPSE